MRTTVDLDPKLLKQIEEITGEKSPSKAIHKALSEFVRKQKLAELRAWIKDPSYIGSLIDNWQEMEELELREMESQRIGDAEAIMRKGGERAS